MHKIKPYDVCFAVPFSKEYITESIITNREKPLADSFSKIHANIGMVFISEISSFTRVY